MLLCIAVTFACIARILVLLDADAYGSALTVHSSVVDYVYVTVGSVVNWGFGDAGPVSGAARIASIVYAGVTLGYLLWLFSHLWLHEAREARLESLLEQYMSEQYVGAPGSPPP